MVIDYRKLDSHTIPDRIPMPVINDMLAQLGGAKVFTSLDLLSGYWQVPLDEESKPLTALIKNREATTVADALKSRIIARHSCPQTLLSDNAGEFTSDILKKLCEFYETYKCQFTAYKPSSNEAVERTNRKIKEEMDFTMAHDICISLLQIKKGAILKDHGQVKIIHDIVVLKINITTVDRQQEELRELKVSQIDFKAQTLYNELVVFSQNQVTAKVTCRNNQSQIMFNNINPL
ncbi:uncharacterized protein LOC135209523 [Macrobrachium nipponense]|uniref:uncharacterized protein LOC135209523 n=1 Tax=Macrobrachium nipponense TaxID=159736 RepID=UPI0030C8A04D